MKYSVMRGHLADTTVKGNLKKRAAQALSTVTQPPASPPTVVTGRRGDFQGNVYAQHSGRMPSPREVKRGGRLGGFGGIKPLRSRIQRMTRRARTGGVR